MKLDKKMTKGDRGPVGPQGPIGPAGASGAAGPTGANGANGAAGLPYDIGNGEPALEYTQTTAIGQRYLDGVSGKVWQRIVFGTEFGPDTLVLAGNLTWKTVATLKGPQGPNRLNQNTIIDLDEYISDAGNAKRMRFENQVTRFQGQIHARENVETANDNANLKGVVVGYNANLEKSEVLLYSETFEIAAIGVDPFDSLAKKYVRLMGVVAATNSALDVQVLKDNIRHTLAQFIGVRLVTKFNGNGIELPVLITADILAIPSPTEGQMLYNGTLQTPCFYNGTSWQKVTSTAM